MIIFIIIIIIINKSWIITKSFSNRCVPSP